MVLFSVDTWRADHLALYGYERPTSPALTRLARDAVVFEQAFSAGPHTAPSHMSMLTGVPPLAHGVMNVFASPTIRALAPSIRTLAEMLKAHGYRTAAFTGAGNVRGLFGFARGFDSYVEDEEAGMNGNRQYSLDPSAALGWMKDAAARPEPFFLFLHTYVPHAPYLPPPPYDTRYDPAYRGRVASNRAEFFASLARLPLPIDAAFWNTVNKSSPDDVRHLRALYDGECNTADDAVATFAAALDEGALSERTILIVTSDHGELFGEHGGFVHPGELWDELLHVPLVVRTPATRGRGSRVATPVGALDLVPTVLDLAGLPADPQPIGRSMVPLMMGQPDATERIVVGEFLGATKAVGEGFEPTRWKRSLRTARHKLIRRAGFPEGDALYDLAADPDEQQNVIEDAGSAAVRARLHAASDALERAEASLRGAQPEETLSEETIEELRALGYVE